MAPGTYSFLVTMVNPAAGATFATTSIIIVPVNRTLTSIVVSPSSVSLNEAGSLQLAAAGKDQSASLRAQPAFTWSASGGTVDATGLFTAPFASGSFQGLRFQRCDQQQRHRERYTSVWRYRWRRSAVRRRHFGALGAAARLRALSKQSRTFPRRFTCRRGSEQRRRDHKSRYTSTLNLIAGFEASSGSVAMDPLTPQGLSVETGNTVGETVSAAPPSPLIDTEFVTSKTELGSLKALISIAPTTVTIGPSRPNRSDDRTTALKALVAESSWRTGRATQATAGNQSPTRSVPPSSI